MTGGITGRGKRCGICRHYEPATTGNQGWCRNPRLYPPGRSQPEYEEGLGCAFRGGDYWESSDALDDEVQRDPKIPGRIDSESLAEFRDSKRIEGVSQRSDLHPRVVERSPEHQESSANYNDSGGAEETVNIGTNTVGSTFRKKRRQRSAGSGVIEQEQSVSYQAEERYWTDYLRIALPIAGLLLLLGVFWYWASSFIGDDTNNDPTTPIADVITTPITAESPTPTIANVVTIPVQTMAPTPAAPEPTVATDPTQAPDTEDPPVEGNFIEGDRVVVIENDVRMRADPTTQGEIVETLAQGTELNVLSSSPTDADGYTWWNVEDPLTENTGWVAEELVEIP
ncbi:hypothetical protein BH23CHL5_BH23CHL5_23580 [soil metagenome]